MEYRLLGPLQVLDGDRLLELRAKERTLLSVLLLHANETVSADRLIDEVWGERPPGSAPKLLATYVWQLRKALGPVIETRPPGYALVVPADRLDTARFEALVARAREEEAAGAAATLRQALGLWRGRALADVTFESSARDDVARLEDERLSALAQRIDHDLALGRHESVLGELRELVRDHPFRERYRGQLMLALYRSGRQAEALEVYRDARRRFVDELGLEPGPQLQQLERAILDHAPELDAPARAPAPAAEPREASPEPRSPLLRRDRLHELLAEALRRRLTTVIADAGYGKSTLLSEWTADLHSAWYGVPPEDASLASFARGVTDALRLRVPGLPPDVARAVTAAGGPGAEADELARARGFAAAVCETLQSELTRDLVLVLDDVHHAAGSAGALQVIEALCRQAPPLLHVVLASRTEIPFAIERLRGQGQVLEVTGSHLAFDVEETAHLLDALAGAGDDETAAELQRATGGWPAAVRLAVEALRGLPADGRSRGLAGIRQRGGPLYAYLASEVFAHESPAVQELVRVVAPLERFTVELCSELGIDRADEILDSLARRGLFVDLRGHDVGWYSLNELMREFALAHLERDAGATHDTLLRAARWYEEHGFAEDALRCLAAAEEPEETARVLASRGPALLAQGSVDAVLSAVELVRPELREPAVEQLAGEAYQVRGNWDEALRCYDRAARGEEELPPGLAWRTGLLHHLAGRLDEALATYERASDEGDPHDVALLLAWRASLRWLRAEAAECREDATRAFEIASRSGDPRALAAAHTVLAMLAALEGDRGANDAHYLRALDYAQQAGDVLQVIRVRTNRGSRHLEEGAYEEALAELDIALRLADLAGFASFRALALTNRGEARGKLARFEEAVADLEDARALYERLGSRMVGYPLLKLGEIYLERGDWALARAAYEEAVAQNESSGDFQGLIPALSGLARVLVAEEPERAAAVAERALALGPGMGHVHALLTASGVALARGDPARAGELAAQAAAGAGLRRDRAALAEALELRALVSPDPKQQHAWLEEAELIWQRLRNPLGQARVTFVKALLAHDAETARAAEERLQALGARGYRLSLSLLRPLEEPVPVAVQSLGRFRVVRDGTPVPITAWPSRTARDLLKILVARRGRPAPHDYLEATLRPDAAGPRQADGLDALVVAIRSVLDPDERHDPEHFVVANAGAVWLQVENVAVDVEVFLEAAVEALELRRSDGADAFARLAAAEGLYTGDFLEENASAEWAMPLREETRAVYTEVARALAVAASESGEADAATRYYLRILERDAYDEPAHLGLVAVLERAGRRGEARRVYQTYCARMDTLGVESAPFPGAIPAPAAGPAAPTPVGAARVAGPA